MQLTPKIRTRFRLMAKLTTTRMARMEAIQYFMQMER